jgi:hypothetical protein
MSGEEYGRPRCKLAKLRTECAIEKKVLGYFAAEAKYGFIACRRKVWPIRAMCRVLRISATGFCDWFERPPSRRQQANAKFLGRVRGRFAANDQTYGSPRIMRA